jgi:hypothetical protein
MFSDTDKRRVALTRIGPFEVSTVFLGIDHNFRMDGPPMIFETMTFLEGMREDYDMAVAFLAANYCTKNEQPVDVLPEEVK